MALALSMSITSSSRAVHCLSPSHNERLFAGHLKTLNLVLPRHPLSPFALAFSRRRNNGPAITSSSSSSKKKKKSLSPRVDDDDAFEDDPFEALFSQLEEDLKNDDSTIEDDDEINEEDLDKLALELEKELSDADMEITATEEEKKEEEDDYGDDDDDDEEEEEREVRLKNWQLRKLAYALKKGRRRVSIKSIAAELCLDRSVVLEMLREPPPNLLMLSAALPDEPAAKVLVHEVKHTETIMAETTVHAVEPETKEEEPVHDRQHRWSAQKRLKKVQVKTLEMVYRRSKRPSNAMISSIVQVTNLPRRRIVKWFEDKRAEEGVPEQRTPYQWPDPETVSSR